MSEIDFRAVLEHYGVNLNSRNSQKVCCEFHSEREPSMSVDIDKGVFHCLGGETLVGTKAGSVRIDSIAGTSVELLTSKGWVKSEVKSYGLQRLSSVVVRRNGVRKEIRATIGHRWIVCGSPRGDASKRKIVTTGDLMPGMTLASEKPAFAGVDMDIEGIRHGFIYGDGMIESNTGTSRVVIHDEVKREFVRKYFDDPREYAKGTATASRRHPIEYRELPSIDAVTDSYLVGFLAGYFAADGNVSSTGMATIASAKPGDIEFIRDASWRTGVTVGSLRSQTRDVHISGKDYIGHTLYIATIIRDGLPDEFFLRRDQFENAAANRQAYQRARWVVESVSATGDVEEVYCAEVPSEHEFVLDDYILTGNCFSCGEQGNAWQFIVKKEGGDIERARSIEASFGGGAGEAGRGAFGNGGPRRGSKYVPVWKRVKRSSRSALPSGGSPGPARRI